VRRERHLIDLYKLCLCLTKNLSLLCCKYGPFKPDLDVITFCSDTHMRFLNTLCCQNAEILNVPAGVVYCNHFLSHLHSVFVCVYNFYVAS